MLSGVAVEGYIDLLDVTNPKRIGIYDYKTRSQFRRSGASRNLLTQAELAADVQMVTYAAWAHQKYQADVYDLSHVYIRTQGKPAAEIVTTAVTPDMLSRPLNAIADTVADMVTHAALPIEAVEPNWDACFDYRRPCPFIAQCTAACGNFPPPPADVLEEVSNMSITEKAAAHKAAGRTTATAAPQPAATDSTGTPGATVSTGGLSIYIDCMPTKGVDIDTATLLEDEIARRTREILDAVIAGKLSVENLRQDAAVNVVDLREVKFGTGTTALIANFKRNPPTGVVIASSSGMSGTVVDALLPLAALVVRGLA
jgi:hypothetical protein